MKPMLTRRRMLAASVSVAVGLVAPAVAGWTVLVRGLAQPKRDAQQGELSELAILTGAPVTAVNTVRHFWVRTADDSQVEVVVPPDVDIWAAEGEQHELHVGDLVHATGKWEGAPGKSRFVAEKVSFNIDRLRGVAISDARRDGDAVVFAVDGGPQGRWEVRVSPETLLHAAVVGVDGTTLAAGPQGAELVKQGWGVDVVGYRVGQSILATWIEAYATGATQER